MAKFLVLLKYLKRNAITKEAVQEIGSVLGYEFPDDIAARISTAFQTRGMVGLTEIIMSTNGLATYRVAPAAPETVIAYCPQCGTAFRV